MLLASRGAKKRRGCVGYSPTAADDGGGRPQALRSSLHVLAPLPYPARLPKTRKKEMVRAWTRHRCRSRALVRRRRHRRKQTRQGRRSRARSGRRRWPALIASACSRPSKPAPAPPRRLSVSTAPTSTTTTGMKNNSSTSPSASRVTSTKARSPFVAARAAPSGCAKSEAKIRRKTIIQTRPREPDACYS